MNFNDSKSDSSDELLRNHQWVLDSELPNSLSLPEPYCEYVEESKEPKEKVPANIVNRKKEPIVEVKEPQELKIVVQQSNSFISKLSLVLQVYLVFLLTFIVYHMKDKMTLESKVVQFSIFS